MGHSTVAKSHACLAASVQRLIPLGLGDSGSRSADCRDSTSCEARVVEATGTRDKAAVAVCDIFERLIKYLIFRTSSYL
jgi:hypothetical protein